MLNQFCCCFSATHEISVECNVFFNCMHCVGTALPAVLDPMETMGRRVGKGSWPRGYKTQLRMKFLMLISMKITKKSAFFRLR